MNPKFWFGVFEETPGNISGSPGAGSRAKEPMTAEDDLKFLREEGNQDDQGNQEEDSEDEKPPKSRREESERDEEKESSESRDEEEQDEEEEEVEEEEQEEEEEEEIVGALVTARDLKDKFPDIFKKVPELRNVIYREQQYSQLFADPNEAQIALELAETFRTMEGDIMEGKVEPFFTAVKNTKSVDFNKFAANILPTLRKLDESTFMKAIAVPLKQILRSAFSEGRAKDNKNLAYAAQYIHDFVFNDVALDEKADFEKEVQTAPNPEEEKYRKKLEELDRRDHGNFKKDVDLEWLGGVTETFNANLDPDKLLSKWARGKMLEDAVRELNKQMTADTRHMKNMDALWRQARASGYSLESKTRIVNAALARAKQIIPQVREKLMKEAFAKDRRGSEREGLRNENRKFIPNKPANNGRGNERQRSRPNPKSTAEMSDLDIIRS